VNKLNNANVNYLKIHKKHRGPHRCPHIDYLDQWFLTFTNTPNPYVILKACFEPQFVVQ